MAARLEVEIDGVNTGLKKALNESLADLSKFNRAILNVKPTGVNALNTSLSTTKRLLQDIASLSQSTRNPLGGFGGSSQNTSTELNAARVASENYRTESARLRSELDALRLANAQNRQSVAGAAGSYREAQQRLTALGRSIREAEGGFNSSNPAIQRQIAEYRQLNTQLRTFDAQLGNHQRNVGNYRSALNGIVGFAAGAFGFTALIAAGSSVVRNNKEISDSLSDVRRTAGLTAKEATELGVALKGIDTRSTLKELLSISKIGGQLGIDKSQLVGFTKAVDQLAVALGDELKGGAEGIAKSLGVLDNVFKISANNGGNVEKSYNQIGSAILQLGQSGLATGDFLADFSERVGGIAKQAGISLPTVLSFGAVLQENGVSAEVAGTAFKRLISAISSNSGKFFDVAKMADTNLTLKEFNNIVNTDTKKALDLFFAGLQKGGSSTVAFNSILKNLKLSGAGVSQVISALSSNIPALNKHIDESTKALSDGTLASEQFAIKNDNLAASFDKLGNALTNITTNPDSNIGRWMKELVDSFTGGIKVVDKLAGKISNLFDAVGRTNDQRLIADNVGNVIPLGASAQAELDAAKKREAQRKKVENDAIKSAKASEALKIGSKLNRDALIDIQAESNSKTILAKTNDRLALEEKNLADVRARYSQATTNKLKDELGKQLIAQREFVRLLKLEAQSLNPRSTAEAPVGLGKGKKSAKGFSLSDTMDQLRKALALTEVQFGDTFDEKNKAKISAYQAAINAVTNALGAQSGAVKQLQKDQLGLFQLTPSKSVSAVKPEDKKSIDKASKQLTVSLGKANVPSLFNEELAEVAKTAKEQLNRAVLDFGFNFFRTLTTINQQVDRSFIGIAGAIGENITGMLQDTFGTQLSGILNKLLEGTKISATQAGIAIAGIAGGLISGITKKTSLVGQGAGGALTGAASGAAIGSAIPGIGTAAGAIVGGLAGALGGILGASKARKEERELQKRQLEESKKQTEIMRQNAMVFTSSIIGRMTDQGVLTNVEVGAFGQLKATVSGKQIDFVLDRTRDTR